MSKDTKLLWIYLLCAASGIGCFAAIILGQQVYLGWLLIALTPAALIWRVWRLRAGSKRRAWLSVEGVITESEVWQYRFIKYGSSIFAPRLRYHYNLAGKAYAGGPVIYGKTGSPTEILRPYPPGKPITVYYDPRRPEQSALHVGNGTWDYLALLLPLALLVFGIGLASGQIFPAG